MATTSGVFRSPAHIGGMLLLTTFMFPQSSLAKADSVADIDGLTQQWLQIEKQQRQLALDWQAQEPALQQRIQLLKEEKAQLVAILDKSNQSQDDVKEKRNALLAEQNEIEAQQQGIDNALNGLTTRVEGMYAELPPLVKRAWEKEQLTLDGSDESSKRLQVSLAKLSRLAQFDSKITVNEAVMTAPDGKDVVVKQLYLGSHYAWFTNADGSYTGIGKPSEGAWQWRFDDAIDGQQINQALAVFERRQQPEFVTLPVILPASRATSEGGR